MNQRITHILREKTISYETTLVTNFWLKQPEYSTDEKTAISSPIQTLENCLKEIENAVICLQTPEITHNKAIELLFKAAQRKNRIYLLVNKKDSALEKLAGCCLIRYGEVKNSGTVLLVHPQQQTANNGLFLSGALSVANVDSPQSFSMPLNRLQIRQLFVFFCDNFWNKAQFEIKQKEDFNKELKASKNPNAFLVPSSGLCHRVFILPYLIQHSAAITRMHIPSWEQSPWSKATIPRALVLTDRSIALPSLKALEKQNNQIYSSTNTELHCALTNNGGWLLSQPHITESSAEQYFALELDAEQSKQLQYLLDAWKQQSNWQYQSEQTRGSLLGKTIRLIAEKDKEWTIQHHHVQSLPTITLPEWKNKDAFEKTMPREQAFADDAQHTSITYTWEVHPFFLPSAASKDPLYKNWDDSQKQYEDYWNYVQKNLSQAMEKEKEFKEASFWGRVSKFFLGQNQQLKKLQIELDTLKGFAPNRSRLTQQRDSLYQIQQKIGENTQEIEQSVQQAKIQELADKILLAEEDFQKWNDTETRELKKKRTLLESKTLEAIIEKNMLDITSIQHLFNKVLKNKDLTDSLKQTIQGWLKRLESTKPTENDPSNDTPTPDPEAHLKQAQEFCTENALLKYIDLNPFLHFLKSRFKEDVNMLFTGLTVFEKEERDFQKEKDQKSSAIQNLKNEKNSLEKSAKPSTTTTGSKIDKLHANVSPKNKAAATAELPKITIPEEDKPSVGALYKHQQHRYLAIEYWEETEPAKEEAERLHAKLCVNNQNS